MSRIEVVGDREAIGFVVYGIRDKGTRRFGYVGQSGNFQARVRFHARAGFLGSRTKLARRWMYEILSSGGTLEIVLLAKCATEEESLAAETEWVGKLTAAGHNLTNRWREHQKVIREVKSRSRISREDIELPELE